MHCTKMHYFCGLKFAFFHAICRYCIISMHPTHVPCMLHLTHNHLCIVLGLPRPSNQAQGSLTRHTSEIFIPLHISSSGFFNPQHCIPEIFISLHCHHISRDLYPTSYHGISTPLHCISLHISSKGLYPFTSRDLYLSAYLNISIHCIIALIKPNQHFIIVHDPSRAPTPTPGLLILLGLPRPLQVFFPFRASTPDPSFLYL